MFSLVVICACSRYGSPSELGYKQSSSVRYGWRSKTNPQMLVPLATTWSEGESKRRALKLQCWSPNGHKSASAPCLSQPEPRLLLTRNRLIPFITVTFKYKPAGTDSSSQSHSVLPLSADKQDCACKSTIKRQCVLSLFFFFFFQDDQEGPDTGYRLRDVQITRLCDGENVQLTAYAIPEK